MSRPAVADLPIALVLFAAYPVETRNVPERQALAMDTVYEQGLADLPESLARRAVDLLIKTSERMPTVAAIRRMAVELQHGPPRPGGDAWGDALRAMQQFGGRTPGVEFHFVDPLVAHAVRSLGWSTLLRSEDTTADRARFIQLYDQLSQAARLRAQAAPGATSSELPAAGAPLGLRITPKAQWPEIVAAEAGKRALAAAAEKAAERSDRAARARGRTPRAAALPSGVDPAPPFARRRIAEDLAALEANRCPTCQADLEGTKQRDGELLAVPCGHVLRARRGPATLGQAVKAYLDVTGVERP